MEMFFNVTLELSGCDSDPCLFSGECKSINNGGYTCLCQDGYTGSQCEERMYVNADYNKGSIYYRVYMLGAVLICILDA